MKTNGYIVTVMAFLWLALSPPIISQAQKREIFKSPQILSTSQIDKYPSDLLSTHIKQSKPNRNAINSPSNLAEFHSDSIIYYSANHPDQKETFTYNGNGNLISYLKETMGNLDWVNSESEYYTYDDNGNVLTELKQTWVDFFWEKNYLLTYTYDNMNNMLTYLLQRWESGQWTNYNFYTYTYNVEGGLTSCMEQYWAKDQWINSSLSTNHFDDRGNVDISERQIWVGTNWESASRNVNSYDIHGSVTKTCVQYWVDADWINSELYTYTYDNTGNLLVRLLQYYIDEAWINLIMDVNTFDSDGNNVTNCELYWMDQDWVYYYLITRTYDEQGLLLSELRQEWADDWNNISNTTFTYDKDGNCLNTLWYLWNINQWEYSTLVEYEYDDEMIRGTGYIWDGSGWLNGDAMMDLLYNMGDSKLLLCEWYGTMAEVYFTTLFTGVSDAPIPSPSELAVFPNPASEYLTINASGTQINSTAFCIYDITGKQVHYMPETRLNAGQMISLDVSKLAPGIYFLGMKSGNNEYMKKFSIAR